MINMRCFDEVPRQVYAGERLESHGEGERERKRVCRERKNKKRRER